MINCADCRHYRVERGEIISVFEWCQRNRNPDSYSITGRPIRGAIGTAWSARRDESKCGPNGQWFEPKPHFWRQLWRRAPLSLDYLRRKFS